MLLLTGAVGWILLAANPGELAGWPHASQGQPPAAQQAGATSYAPAFSGGAVLPTPPAGASAPAWSHGASAPRFDPAVRPAAYQQPVVTAADPLPPAGNIVGASSPVPISPVPISPVPISPVPISPVPISPVPITPRSGQPSLPLAPPGASSSSQSDSSDSGPVSLVTVAASLGVVVGIFLLTAWGIRRAAPQGLQGLPKEAFEVLGRAPLAGRQQAHLLRLGNKLVLVSLTPAGAETLAEITDPMEVDRVAGLCRQSQSGSATAVFRQVLGQFAAGRPTAEGDAGGTRESSSPAAATPGRYGTAERYHG